MNVTKLKRLRNEVRKIEERIYNKGGDSWQA